MLQGGLYLFTGPDRYRKRERLKAIAQALHVHPLDWHEAGATQLSATTLITWVRQHPVASPLRLIVIDDAHRLDSDCLRVLEGQTQILNQTACVILCVDVEIDAARPLARLKTGASLEQFAWLAPHEVSQWVRGYVASHQKRLADAAIHTLLQAYGADLAGLRAILDQLISWVGPRPQLTEADLRIFLSPSASVPARQVVARRGDTTTRSTASNGFALVDAIAKRDLAAALRALHGQLMGGEDAALKLLGLVAWQLQRWLTAARLAGAGLSQERIERLAGIRPWQLDRMVQLELAGRSLDSLKQALHACWELDAAAKNGRIPLLRVALEQLVVRLCLSTT